ncbi:MAG: ADP-ribosylglycohydrolase family protein [Pseudothermotoga sp.]|nr:ADP-ribosylglycohydrolase family protein [Pseudothermotoga sp.]
MKAWQYEHTMRREAKFDPTWKSEWGDMTQLSVFSNDLVSLFWSSRVPGSGAPECLMAGAIQSVENMGRDVSRAEKLFEDGLKFLEEKNFEELKVVTASIFNELEKAPIVRDHPYHSFEKPSSWKAISNQISHESFRFNYERLYSSVLGGWFGQISAASMGTKFEGFFGEQFESFERKDLPDFVEEEGGYNDDIVYEVVAMEALYNSVKPSSRQIASYWLKFVPFGWSAEYVALENLKRGIFPPKSGAFRNPFQEWIGAQMRCMLYGLMHPARPYEAARFAHMDSIVSHAGNGVYGGMHSAVLTSLAFAFKDPRQIILKSLEYVPKHSEFANVLRRAINWCENTSCWRQVREKIEEEFKNYNWIHVYPNLCCVVTALWFGEANFDASMEIVLKMGFDVDCNAGEVGTVLGVLLGVESIPTCWLKPLRGTVKTYLKGFEKLSIERLAKNTLELFRRFSP